MKTLISVSIDCEIIEELRQSNRDGLSISGLIEKLIRDYLKASNTKSPAEIKKEIAVLKAKKAYEDQLKEINKVKWE